MRNFLRRLNLVLSTLLLPFIGQAQAVANAPLDECCDPCHCAPACCGKGFVSADLLYWRAFQGGLDDCFAIESVDYITSSGDVISKFRGEGEDPHYNWQAGFRLGVGYEFGNCWDVGVFWTHFHSNSKEREGNEHKLRWKLDFEVLDIVAGRSFDVGSCFAVRGFGGLRAARIEQKLRINSKGRADSYLASSSYGSYFDSYGSSYDSYSSVNSEIFREDLSTSGYSSSKLTTGSGHGKNKLMGVGPLIGIEGDWKLGCGFSLYANASFAILYGNFRVHFNQSEEFVDGGDFCNIKRRLHACQAVVDAGFGVRWETCICENIVWLQLGLEHHRYFNQNRFGDYGDLCLDGGNFSAGFAF